MDYIKTNREAFKTFSLFLQNAGNINFARWALKLGADIISLSRESVDGKYQFIFLFSEKMVELKIIDMSDTIIEISTTKRSEINLFNIRAIINGLEYFNDRKGVFSGV